MDKASLQHYLKTLNGAIYQCNGTHTASFLSLQSCHVRNQRLFIMNPTIPCSRILDEKWSEVVAMHLRVIVEIDENHFAKGFVHQISAVQIFTKTMQSMAQMNWMLPVLFNLIRDMRILAFKVDALKNNQEKEHDCMEKSAEVLMSCFRVCANDTRTTMEMSKKWAMMNIVNNLLKIYFKINKMHLCKPMIRSIDALAFKDYFQIGQRVTYNYYVGRRSMYEGDLVTAESSLISAFHDCHMDFKKNKRQILIYLVPVKMLLGHMPKIYILKKYDLSEFSQLSVAIKTGNVKLFNKVLHENQDFYIFYGIYMTVEKLKILTYRNLFKKMANILDTHQLPVSVFGSILSWLEDEEICNDEVEMIIANLIATNKMKGYISHFHGKVIVGKQTPFPRIPALAN